MQKDKSEMLTDILGVTKAKKNSYYVYALYENDNTMPFYIGKGRGDRVLAHQKESESTMDDIYQHTRGIWNIGESRRKELKYAISLYRAKV